MPRHSASSAKAPSAPLRLAEEMTWTGAVVAIGSLATDVVPDLVRQLNRSDLGELEVRSNGWRVRLRRPAGADQGATAQTQPRRPERGAIERSGRTKPEPDRVALPADDGLVMSPAVGYFVERAGTDVGTTIRGGDAIGAIDVLGVREDVVVPSDAVIENFEVAAGQAVEYGQPIARVRRVASAQLSEG